MAITPELETWIKNQLKAGYAPEVLKKSLREQGWNEEDIGKAFSKPPTSPPTEQVKPKKLDDEADALLQTASSANTDPGMMEAGEIPMDPIVAEGNRQEYESYGEPVKEKKPLPLIPIALVLMLLVGGGYYFFFMGSDDSSVLENGLSSYDSGEDVWVSETVSFKGGEALRASEYEGENIETLEFYCKDGKINSYCEYELEDNYFIDDYFDCSPSRVEAIEDTEGEFIICCDEGDCAIGFLGEKPRAECEKDSDCSEREGMMAFCTRDGKCEYEEEDECERDSDCEEMEGMIAVCDGGECFYEAEPECMIDSDCEEMEGMVTVCDGGECVYQEDLEPPFEEPIPECEYDEDCGPGKICWEEACYELDSEE